MAFPGLEDSPLGLGDGEIVALARLPVDFHSALVDHPAPVARRFAQLLGQESGQMNLTLRNPDLPHVVRRLVLPHDPGEVLLPAPRALLPVPARDDAARELEL